MDKAFLLCEWLDFSVVCNAVPTIFANFFAPDKRLLFGIDFELDTV